MRIATMLKCLGAIFVLFAAFCPVYWAGAGEPDLIRPADRVRVEYTCRLESGAVVATTSAEVAEEEFSRKSRFFPSSAKDSRTVFLRAGDVAGDAGKDERLMTLSDHIAVCLGSRLVGLPAGQETTLEIRGDLMSGLSDQDRYLQLARIWRYPKKEILARQEYEKSLGKAPTSGAELPWRAPFTARVAEIGEHFVTLEVSVPPDTDMDTPFGTGRIRDGGERWEVAVDARAGTVVRSGPLLGRIVEVGEELFKVDFGYPFGNEPLFCEVTAYRASEDLADAAPREGDQAPAEARGPELTGDRDRVAPYGGASKDEAAARPVPEAPAFTAENGEGESPQPPARDEDPKENPGKVEQGDLVTVHYKATLEDGSLVQTNLREVLEDPRVRKAAGFRPAEEAGPLEILAGEEAVFPGLGYGVLGMALGEKKTVPLVPERAFGPSDPKNTQTFDAVKRIPRVAMVTAANYHQRFGTFPVRGKEVPFTPYFKSRVIEVTEDHVTLEALARDGEQVKNEFGGLTDITVQDDEVVLQLIPEVGSPFRLEDRQGIISAFDEETFTVDFNPPLSGKPIVLELEVLSLTKASALSAMQLEWMEDHDQALDAAFRQGKPVVLVLYAAWCGYSKKLLNESLEDPRIRRLKDDFIWTKVDSDVQRDLKELYEQKGFPLILLLSPEGAVLSKIDGYRPGAALSRELKQALESRRLEGLRTSLSPQTR